ILQARYSSSRLPGKVVKPIVNNKPMLEIEISRILKATKLDKLVVATSTSSDDDAIQDLCNKVGVSCFRGNLDNVLDRFYQCALLHHTENIVRLTGDCPLIDPEIINAVIKYFE